MNYIDVKIEFLHDARPYIPADQYQNIVISYPQGAIPAVGDVVVIDSIAHPKGAFIVSHRVFESKGGMLTRLTIALDIEGRRKAST